MIMKFRKAVAPSMPMGGGSSAPSMSMAGAMGIPRRKMKSFKIDEISFVDKPAQEGAIATIEKRRRELEKNNLPRGRPFKSGAGAAEIARYNQDAKSGQKFKDHIRQFERRHGVNQNSPRQHIAEALIRESNDIGASEDKGNWRDTAAHHYGFRDHEHVETFNPEPQNAEMINRLQGAVGMGKAELDRIIKMVLINGQEAFLKGAAGGGDVGRAPPLVSALDLSLRTILADTNLSDSDRLVMMRKSTLDFVKVATGELPNLEGYVQKNLDPDVERSETTMNLRQLQKKMNILNSKLDAVINKRGSSEDEAELEEFGKSLDEIDEGDSEGLFDKAGYKAADDSPDEDNAQIAQRLNAMFGHSAVKARRKKPPMGDMGGMDDIRAEINAENADQLDAADQPDMGVDDPDPDDMGKKMKTGPRQGQVTTEGEEEDKIAAGAKKPIGGTGHMGKRTRLHESMIIGDRVVHKADVGPDMFDILKAQQAEMETISKALEDERDTRELLEFAKVAESELPHLPGTTESKARLLKNLAGYLDEDERRLLTSMLKSGDRSAGTAFKTYGHKVEKASTAISFQKRVSAIKSRDQCSYTEAMQKARREHPEDFEAFQYGGQ